MYLHYPLSPCLSRTQWILINSRNRSSLDDGVFQPPMFQQPWMKYIKTILMWNHLKPWWWFQILFTFTPSWGKLSNLTSIFQTKGLKPPTSSTCFLPLEPYVFTQNGTRNMTFFVPFRQIARPNTWAPSAVLKAFCEATFGEVHRRSKGES